MSQEDYSLEAWWASECSQLVAESASVEWAYVVHNRGDDFPVSGDHLHLLTSSGHDLR